MFELIALLIGFVPLVWGANILTDASASLASKYKLSSFFIGLTVVSFGTSSPEIAVNIFAAADHDNFITTGNVLGSNIFNIAIIIGVISLSTPLFIKSNTLRFELIYTFLAGLIIMIMANDEFIDGVELSRISRSEGLVLLFFFLVFTIYLFRLGKNNAHEENEDLKSKVLDRPVTYLLMGLALLIAGGQLIVFSTQGLASHFEVSERIIAILFISIGTSLPELVTAITALKKNNTNLVIGNILGSCIFNIFFVLGLSSIIFPVRVGEAINEDIFVHLLVCSLLFLFVLMSANSKIKRWMGATLILVYTGYFIYLFSFLF